MDFIQQNILLVTVVVFSGSMLIWQTIQAAGGKQVSPADATRMLNREDAVIIDVRSPAEFAAGHAPDSLNIPTDKLKERLTELDKFKGRPLILNCATGARSTSACAILRKLGVENVFNLAGGMNAWVDAGLPIRKGHK